MKKLISFTISLFLSTSLFISCTTDVGDDINQLTARGKTMTDEWNNVTNLILNCYADIAFKLNHHIEDKDLDTEERQIMQHTNDGIWNVYENGELVFSVNTHGQPLDSIGSQWELTSYAYYNDFGLRQDDFTVNFIITCIDTHSWNIYSINKDIPEYFFDVNMSCNDTPHTLINYAFKLSGKGNLSIRSYENYDYYSQYYYYEDTRNSPYYPYIEEYVDLHFETETTLHRTYYYWSKGIINIIAQNREEETSSTRAEFNRKSSSEYITIITYGGITEDWYSYYYY